MTRPAAEKTIFVSHAGADKPRLGPWIERILERTNDLPDPVYIWIDRPGEIGWPPPGPAVGGLANNERVRRLPSGGPWNRAITEAVTGSACVVVFYSDRATPEKSSVFANEILNALFDKKCITLSLDPLRKRDKPDMLLDWIQWTDVSKFVTPNDDGAFDGAIDQLLANLHPPTQAKSKGGSEVFTPPPGFLQDFKELLDFQRSNEMELLSNAGGLDAKIIDRKYIADVFVERRQLSDSLSKFQSSNAQTFAILGDAGMGKTSFLCAVANEMGRAGYVLFYIAIELHKGLAAALERDLAGHIQDGDLVRTLRLLSGQVASTGEHLTIVIDGLNECPSDRQKLRAELNQLIRETEGAGLRWIVSCRTLDWDYWIRNDNNMIGRFGRSIFSDRGDITASGIALEFDNVEVDVAWKKYAVEFGLVGELSPQLRVLCREPFMLRLVAETYKGGKPIPNDIDAMQLFDRLFSERFPDQRQLLAVNKTLMSAAKRTLESGNAYIDVVNLASDEFAVCERLMQENILVRRGDTHLYFRFELVLEYLLSKYLIGSIPAGASQHARVTLILAAAQSQSVNILGALENILVSWQGDGRTVSEIMFNLAQKDSDRWKTVVCAALRKMDQVPNGSDRTIELLAGDSNFVVRRYLAQALSSHNPDDIAPIVAKLAADTDVWERRETAANALRATAGPERSESLDGLMRLADDYHWRVRRAVGYALHDRWRVMPAERDQALEALAQLSWRQRHSISIGLSDCDASGATPAARAIGELASDANHQVRWMIANYLSRYQEIEKSTVPELLLRDADPWVRARTAVALISLEQGRRSAPQIARVLGALAADVSVDVRIGVARGLEKVASEAWAQVILYRYLTDVPEVSFAAAYTLGGTELGTVVDLFGDRALADTDARLWIIRERIARGEVDPATSRFGPVQDIISRNVELPAESDRYMRMIDSMSSLIAAAADVLPPGSSEHERFFDVLCADVDESVRWALVLYVAAFATGDVSAQQKFALLTRLASDRHFWVRREVALALGRWGNDGLAAERIALLEQMWAAESVSSEPCKDEVMHYLSDAFRSSGAIEPGST